MARTVSSKSLYIAAMLRKEQNNFRNFDLGDPGNPGGPGSHDLDTPLADPFLCCV